MNYTLSGNNDFLAGYATGGTVYAGTMVTNAGGRTVSHRRRDELRHLPSTSISPLVGNDVRAVYAYLSTIYAGTTNGLSRSTNNGAAPDHPHTGCPRTP